MRKILITIITIIICFNVNAQTKMYNFAKAWKEVDSLILLENKSKTALQKVNGILKEAIAVKDFNQQAKAYLYKINLENRITENSDDADKINGFEPQISTINDPVLKSIMQLYALRMYVSYYQNNSWKLSSSSTNLKNKTLDSYSISELKDVINNKAKAIFENETILWNTNIKRYNNIIFLSKNKELRNTIYELLAYEVIEHLQNLNDEEEQKDINILNLPNFLNNNLNNSSINYTCNWLLHNIIKKHNDNRNIKHLIDADLFRNTNAKNADINDKINALNYLINTYPKETQTAWAVAAKATYLISQGNNYPSNTNFRFKKQEALELLNNYITSEKINDSICLKKLNNLKAEILDKSLTAKVESVNIPNQPFRLLVEFRNTPQLHYKIIKLKTEFEKENDEETLDINNEKFWNKIKNQKTISNTLQQLPLTNDYQQHQTEIKIDGLNAGKYALIGASSDNFDYKNDALFYITFTVSNIAIIQHNYNLFIVQRDNGQPINNAQIKIYTNKYDPKTSKYINKLQQSTTTDINGFCNINFKEKGNNSYYEIAVKTLNDELYHQSSYVYTSTNRIKKSSTQNNVDFANAHFFTDRSIYRPQQTIQFKGILLTKDELYEPYKLFTTTKQITLELLDVNYTIIDTQTLVVNEFGSFNGSFTLPKQALTGNYTIRTKTFTGATNIKVEEYKRPTFTIDFANENKTYELNKTVTIKGTAKSFAGNNIDNAKMSFVVNRLQQTNNDWGFYRLPYPSNNPTPIAHGNGTTNAEGNFEINFVAAPNNAINKQTNPIFVYTIDVKITDNKGETREANYNIKVGYNNTIINLEVPKRIDISALKHIKLSTTNLQDSLIKKEVNIEWQPLQIEQRLIRERLWEMPDTFVMEKEMYISYFPYDEYKNEAEPKNWKALETAATQSLQTFEQADKNSFEIPREITGNNYYLIKAYTKDENSSIITTQKIIEITQNKQTVKPNYNSFTTQQKDNEKIDTVVATIQSSVKKIFIIKNAFTENTLTNEENSKDTFEYINLNKTGSFDIVNTQLEKDEHSYSIFYAFVQHNRFFTNGHQFVSTDKKDNLNIVFNSFRNKTLPGSKETYSLSIQSKNKKIQDAELLSSMYDASLDEFYNHEWSKPFTDKLLRNTENKFTSRSVGEINNAQVNYDHKEIETNEIEYNKIASEIEEVATVTDIRHYITKIESLKGEFISFNKKNTMAFASIDDTHAFSILDKNYLPESTKSEEKDSIKNTQENLPTKNHPNTTRKNFNETAFFLPNIYANDSGNYSFTVTLPEALTTWKWQNFAHTKNLQMCLSTKTIITQKTLMVQPNIPRFLTQGDVIELATTIANTSDKELTGTCTLQLFNAVTNTPIDGWLNNVFPNQYFTVKANETVAVKFPIQVPQNFTDAITYKIIAQSNAINNEPSYSDGEENSIPVLSNKLYLTNALSFYIKPNEAEKNIQYSFLQQALDQQNNIQTQSVTIEYSPNSIFTVIKALPYLMEYPYECAEQTFNRFFAYSVASKIVQNNKLVQQAINSWKEKDTINLKSNLELQNELKQILLNETPWVKEASNQTQQLQHLASLLDDKNLNQKQQETLKKLKEIQLPNGGFSWFKGGNENTYITQYILTGFGKLIKYNLVDKTNFTIAYDIINKALPLLDNTANKEYQQYLKQQKKSTFPVAPTNIQYWYMRSFFNNYQTKTFPKNYATFSFKQFATSWKNLGIQQQAMLSVAIQNNIFQSSSNNQLLKKINESIIENTIEDTKHDLLYFKSMPYSCYWYENNFEIQSLAIEALEQNMTYDLYVQKLKNWFIFNKQTNHWESTIATASACISLLNKQSTPVEIYHPTIQIGSKIINTTSNGFGTIKETFKNRELLQLSNTIKVTNSGNKLTSYGAIYVQYFQPIENVEASNNPYLSISKKIFIKKNVNNKVVLQEIVNNENVQIGDELVVQLTINCKKQLEFVHLKDNRAAGTEPKNVLSEYKWDKGLNYYMATKDASTNFFIDYLPKGNYTVEYSLNSTHSGKFNTGIATIQCLYAPSFNANSIGQELIVE